MMVLIIGALVAAYIQGTAGFGFAVVAVAFWVWVLDAQTTTVLVVLGSLVGQLINCWRVRRPWRGARLWPMLAAGLLGVPVGAALALSLDVDWLKTVLGCVLLVWSPAMLWSLPLPRVGRWGRSAEVVVGGISGVLGGLGGFTGVLPSLWFAWRGDRGAGLRGMIQHFNLSLLLVTGVLYASAGWVTLPRLQLLAVAAPAMLLGGWLGTRLYHRLPPARFRQVVLVLLWLAGWTLLISGLPALWA